MASFSKDYDEWVVQISKVINNWTKMISRKKILKKIFILKEFQVILGIKFFPFLNLLAMILVVAVGADDAFLFMYQYRKHKEVFFFFFLFNFFLFSL